MSNRETRLAAGDAKRGARSIHPAGEREFTKRVTLPSGVVVLTKRVPWALVAAVDARMKHMRPKPPVVFIKARGKNEENPNDPDYKAALQSWEVDSALATYDVFLLEGVEVLAVPEGMPGPADQDFIERMEALGEDMATEPKRKIRWLRYVAAAEPEAISQLIEEVGNRTFIREDEVEAAAGTFPADEGGGESDDGAG